MADSRESASRHVGRSHDHSESTNFQLYYQLIKPGIVYSNVMTGAAGYLFASRWHVHLLKLIALLIGMGLLIAGSCVLNNYIDRGLDARMERTKKRATAAGQIKTRQVISYGAILIVAGFLILLATNKLTMLLGAFAVLFYVVIYGLAKRHSVYGTLVGALPGGASLVAGYCAVTGRFTFEAFLLLLLMVCWQMPHFYAIAIRRIKDYSAAGLPLWPIKKGVPSAIRQIRIFIIAYILVCFLMAILGYVSYVFFMVMDVAAGYWLSLSYKRVASSTEWAKKVFLCSLVVLLLMSVMLPISTLIP